MNNQLRKIYDAFAKTYEENRGQFDMSDVLDGFYSTLKLENGKLLDLGCGAGEPVARYFTDHNWSVVGVDFSERMIELASKYVPEMPTMHADISEVDFESNQFDAIIASYSLFHISVDKHKDILKKFHKWLSQMEKHCLLMQRKSTRAKNHLMATKILWDRSYITATKLPMNCILI